MFVPREKRRLFQDVSETVADHRSLIPTAPERPPSTLEKAEQWMASMKENGVRPYHGTT